MTEPQYIKDLLDPLLATFHQTLQTEMAGELTDTYMSGSADMMTWGHTQAGIPIAFEGPPMEQAIKWAGEHCATLVTRMDDETRSQLAKVISDGIANKRGPGGLATDIKRELGWMGRGKPSAIKGLTQQGRAYMIARTETASALSQASLDAMNDMGIEGKELVTNDPCEICQGNEAAGVIPVNEPFPSGEMGPPFHPNCECALAPARLKGAEPTAKEPTATSGIPLTPETPVGPALNLSAKAPAPEMVVQKVKQKVLVPQQKKVQDWMASLDSDAKYSHSMWRSYGYDAMRKAERTGRGPADIRNAVKTLNGALGTAPVYDGPIYRGMTALPQSAMTKLANAKIIRMETMTSFSADAEAALNFAIAGPGDILSKVNSVFMTVKNNATGRIITAQKVSEVEVLVRKDVEYLVVGRRIERTAGQNILHMVLEEV